MSIVRKMCRWGEDDSDVDSEEDCVDGEDHSESDNGDRL